MDASRDTKLSAPEALTALDGTARVFAAQPRTQQMAGLNQPLTHLLLTNVRVSCYTLVQAERTALQDLKLPA